jgi:hypothetical protein
MASIVLVLFAQYVCIGHEHVGVHVINAQRAAVLERAMHRAEDRLAHFNGAAATENVALHTHERVPVPAYELLGFGECATLHLGLFDQWKGDRVAQEDCRKMCTGLTVCLGYEVKVEPTVDGGVRDAAVGECTLRFSDGTAPEANPYPATLTGAFHGHNGVGPIMIAWDGKMEDGVREAVFTDRRCYKKTA